MNMHNIVEIVFTPLRILQQNIIPLVGISFYDFWIGFMVVSVLAIPLIKYILSMSDVKNNGASNEKLKNRDKR